MTATWRRLRCSATILNSERRQGTGDLFKLFWGIISISAVTFGGGYVIVPLLSNRFSKSYGWFSEEDMLDIVAIAQSTPGAMAVNCAILIGWKSFGMLGAVIATIAAALPPLVILGSLAFAYDAVIGSPLVAAIFRGLMIGVSIVVLDVVLSLQATLFKKRKIGPIVFMAIAFVLHFWFDVNAVLLILSGIILGIVVVIYESITKGRPSV